MFDKIRDTEDIAPEWKEGRLILIYQRKVISVSVPTIDARTICCC